jgi:branched-chain amino acid transport system substrate-binding protein
MGPIYFNDTNDSSPPIRFGQFVGRSLISTPTQLSAVAHLEIVDLQPELAAGNIVELPTEKEPEHRFFWKQEVVYTGIDINKLGRVEEANSSFSADFYFWMRYKDGADALAIEFPSVIANTVSQNAPIFDPEAPLKAEKINGLNYRLYRISGDFKGRYDFRDYPFDRQNLNIYFQNTKIPSDRLIYAVDTFGLKQKTDPEERKKPYQSLQLWNFENIQYAQANFPNTSTRGNPKLFGTNIQVDYPGLSANITLQRRFAVFLIKTLLPLALLVLVLYSTLYFSENLSKERLKVAISALLSSAVLLTAINAQLSGAGYTVAIEYGFYIFFGLCLFCILVSLMLEKHYETGDKKKALYLDRFARVFYIAIVIGTISTYALLFGDRLS